jgi:F420-non-reducing hydrogenase small subunit
MMPGRTLIPTTEKNRMGNDLGLFGKIYQKGEIVFHQDDPGEEMFIIQSGGVEVSSRRSGGKAVLTLLEKGDFFGEMALLDGKPRSATVTAIARSRLLSLPRRVFLEKVAYRPDVVLCVAAALSRRLDRLSRQIRKMIDGDMKLRALMITSDRAGWNLESGTGSEPAGDRCGAIDSPALLQSGAENAEPVDRIATPLACTSESCTAFDAGQVIFEQGDNGDRMYFIENGIVEIYQPAGEGTLCLALLGAGDYFGEMALITGEPRSASAKARSPARLLPICRNDMLSGIRSDPETGLLFLRILIDRLRVLTRAIEEPESSLKTLRQAVLSRFKKAAEITIGFTSLSSCGGCTAMILRSPDELGRLTDGTRVRYCPMLMDQEQILETDIAVLDGAVRTREDEVKLMEVRRKTRLLVAWGTCAIFGGLPALANVFELEELIEETYGRSFDPFSYYLKGATSENDDRAVSIEEHLLHKVRRVSDVVKVDYYLPGCPPARHLLENLLKEFKGEHPIEDRRQIVCSECLRKFNKPAGAEISVFPPQNGSETICMLSQGTLCLGFLTRGGCNAVCTAGGLPCWGCRGPSDSVIRKCGTGEPIEEVMLQALARRLKQTETDVKKPLRILRFKGTSALGFGDNFVKETAKIR